MAIITKPVGGILKGVPASISLSKSELSALSIIVADSYFSSTSNWNKVILKYRSSTGKQYEAVQFDATLSSPTGNFLVSIKARDAFEIQTIEIHDFDNDIFIVPRSALNVADFDVVLSLAPSSLSYSTPVTYTQNTAITNNVPTVTGTVTSYSILPALPAGLNFNTTTGVISGTPTEVSAAANYVVTASNGAGSTTATINITVEAEEVPVSDYFTYTHNPDNLIISSTGGVSGGPSVSFGAVSQLDPFTGDFSVQFKFNWDSFTQAQGYGGDLVYAVFLGLRTALNSNNNQTGIQISEAADPGNSFKTIRFWIAGTSNTFYNVSPGDHTFTLVKTGTDWKYYIDGVLVYQATNSLSETLYPVVKTRGFVACTESREIEWVTWNVAGKTGVGTVTTGANGLITKATGGAGYNVNVLSNETIIGDGYVEFIWSHGNVVMGLSEINEPNGSYTNTIYGGYVATFGTSGFWEVGAVPGAYNGSSLQNNLIVVGDVIKIERVGNLYKAFKNGLLMHSCNINNTNPLKASISIYSEGTGVSGAIISE